ncbi:Ger(x)C family spore germination protein [Cohnella zeiphila]|uniref:Ger(X)C family spore germination protein n=1 Tax=Cohnella zeiphila TaxID=2761120 RepID=A0A7X0SSF3_9BACL|nr:Ger(x)C family spore germination protein [Cohnella zeiphila]MBB6735302.1 Ger(x)C family spore germination protein [Cohnella zeiphila]
MNAKLPVRIALKSMTMAGMLIVLCGCWDIRDINHRALPIAMGLENKEGIYRIHLLIPQNTQSSSSVRIVSDKGSTINEIIDRISKDLELEVDLMHLKVIVFDRTFAERGLGDSVSSFMRSRDIASKTIAAISDESIGSLFQTLKSTSTTGGLEIYNFFEKNAGWSPQLAQTRIWQIFQSLHSFTKDVAVPIIKSGESTTMTSTGSAVIKNGKMVGRITPEETLLFNAFNGLSAQGKIEVMNHAAVVIDTDRLSHHSSVKGGRAVLNSRINLKVTVLETKGSPTTAMVKQELEQLLTQNFERMFARLQAEGADILGVGQFFRNRIPRDRLANWRTDYYPRMKLNLTFHTVIEDEGLLKMKP